MSASPSTVFPPGIAELMFDTARENGEALGRFGALALAYGQGEITAADAFQSSLLLAAGESRRALELGLQLSLAQARWWSSLWPTA